MGIRLAKIDDTLAMVPLLEQLGYPVDAAVLKSKIDQLMTDPDHTLIVYEGNGQVMALMSIHFVPQLALEGDFAVIGYFAVDQKTRSKGIGKEMEEYCVKLAKDRGCDRIQVHCNIRRIEAHRFYERQGYHESRKYFSKGLK